MIDRQMAILAHYRLFQRGEFWAARAVLCGLRHGTVTLGLNDDDWLAERALERCGATFRTSYDGSSVTCRVV